MGAVAAERRRERKAYTAIEEHALKLIKEMKREKGQQKIKFTDYAMTSVKYLSGACALLNSAPMCLGTGFTIVQAILEKCREIMELEPGIAMLLLDTIMVCELLGTIGRAERDTEKAVAQDARDQAAAKGLTQGQAAAQADEAVKKHRKKLVDVAGRIHVEYLFMAMGSANDVIQSFGRTGCFMRRLKSGGILGDIKAASELLDRARGRMVQAIVTGRALGGIVTESVNLKDAQQAGMMALGAALVLRTLNGTKAQLYMAAEVAALPAKDDPAAWRALLEGPPQCMAITGRLQQCSREAVEVYWYGDDDVEEPELPDQQEAAEDPASQAQAQAQAQTQAQGPDPDYSDDEEAVEERKVVCVCSQHGTRSAVVTGHPKMHRMVPAPNLPQVADLARLPPVQLDRGTFGTVLGITRPQLQLIHASWGWTQLAKRASPCCFKQAGGPAAACKAPVKCFKANAHAARGLPGRDDDVFTVVGMCGNHVKDTCWGGDAASAFRTVYVDKKLAEGANLRAHSRNTQELLGPPQAQAEPPPGPAALAQDARGSALPGPGRDDPSGSGGGGLLADLPPIGSSRVAAPQPETPPRQQRFSRGQIVPIDG